METVTLTFAQLSAYGEMVATRTIEKLNLTKIYITYAEMSRPANKGGYGVTRANQARRSPDIHWVMKGSDNKGCYCLKSEFEIWISRIEIEAYQK